MRVFEIFTTAGALLVLTGCASQAPVPAPSDAVSSTLCIYHGELYSEGAIEQAMKADSNGTGIKMVDSETGPFMECVVEGGSASWKVIELEPIS